MSVSQTAIDFFRAKGRGHNHAQAKAAQFGMPGFHLLADARHLRDTAIPKDITALCDCLQSSCGGPGIQDQHQVGACEGYAHSSGVTLFCAAQKQPIKRVSPVQLYQCALMLQRPLNPDGTTIAPLQDTGTEPSVIQQVLATYGACSAETWGGEPPTPDSIIIQPDLGQLEKAQTFLLVGMHLIQSTGDQYLRDLMTAWANGYPTTGAIAASSDTFNGYTGGVLSAMDDQIDHATLWIGGHWDGTNPSSLVGIGVNSWGDGQEGDPAWGESDAPGIVAGMYRADASFFNAYNQSTYVLDIRPVSVGEYES